MSVVSAHPFQGGFPRLADSSAKSHPSFPCDSGQILGRRRETRGQADTEQSRQARASETAEQEAQEDHPAHGLCPWVGGRGGRLFDTHAQKGAFSVDSRSHVLGASAFLFQKPTDILQNQFSTGHANSPCTIVVGRAHLEKVTGPARPCRILNSFVPHKPMDFGEDLSGKSTAGALFVSFSFLFTVHLRHMEVPRLGVTSELQLRPMPQPQPHRIRAASVIDMAACGNARSLTH